MEFTNNLQIRIKMMEKVLKEQIDKFLQDYKSAFAKKNLKLDAVFVREGTDCFKPGYHSSISIGITEKSKEMAEVIDIRTIKIWECERIFSGIPVSKNIPGSKIIGVLLDETEKEIQKEIHEYMEDLLMEDM